MTLDSEKWKLTSIFENSGGERDMSSAEEDDIIDAIYGHSELTMTLCVCVCVCVQGRSQDLANGGAKIL